MTPRRIMFIAGEASGDALAAELVRALTLQLGSSPEMFGAGGPKMAAAGVDLAIDMTTHSVIGLIEVVKKYSWFKKVFAQLRQLALERKPDLIVCVDFSGFNRRFARAIRAATRVPGHPAAWQPRIVQFVSPQVWASRPSRADKMAPDLDLLLCLFPFEKDWYAKRTPALRVEFVGHPIADRPLVTGTKGSATPTVLLLPGSRAGELKRHLPVMIGAAQQIAADTRTGFEMVLPSEHLVRLARQLGVDAIPNLQLTLGDLEPALSRATLAIASTGTVTLECARFGVPAIAMYKTSWSTYQIGKRIIQVKYLAMPNLLANALVFPEFIQNDATPDRIAREAVDLLQNPRRRQAIQSQLGHIIASLGGPGASQRAAKAILSLP